MLIDCLRNEGVDRIFGIPGEENLDVMDEIHSSGMEFVLTRHEQAAAFMAGTVGRLTGRPGVCLSTLGPGATNLVSGVADAYLSNIPLIALVAQAGETRRNPPQKQVLDLLSIYRPMTKLSVSIDRPDDVPKVVDRAFKTAVKERSGPVMVQLPEDVMKMSTDATPRRSGPLKPRKAEERELEVVVNNLRTAKKPLMIVGHGALRSQATHEIKELCHAWNIPVACTWMAAGAVPFDDLLSLGTIGMRNSDLVKESYDEADLVLSVGYDVTEFQPQFWNKGTKKRVLHLGDGSAGRAKDFFMDIEVIGDLRSSLQALTDVAFRKEDWASAHRDKLLIELERPGEGAKGLVQALRRQLGRGDVLVSDVGAHLIWLAKYYPAYAENTLLLQNGLICMGAALPSAIAAKLVHPDHKVVAVVGDGGFLMSSAELETARRLGLKFVTVIFNDGGLGLIREKMQRNLGRVSNVDLGSPDIPTYARSFGAEGYTVAEKDFEPVLQDCLERDVLAVIDVKVDYSHNCLLF